MKIKINDFSGGIREDKSDSLKSLAYPKKLFNLDVSTGSIKMINALKKLGDEYSEVLAEINSKQEFGEGSVYFYRRFDFERNQRDDKLIIFDSLFNGFYVNLYGEKKLTPLGVKFSARPIITNYRLNGEDVAIMVSEKDNMVVWNGVSNPEIILDAPKIKSMDIHYERLFAVTSDADNTELKFSDDLDPTNWSESLSDAGFISLVDSSGGLEKVLSFNDYLYVFRKHGITRIYANTALQSSFYVNHLFVSGGEIFGNTVAVAGDRVLMLSRDGFYVFDGQNTSKVLSNVFPLLNITGKEEAVFFDGCYYLTCASKGSVVNNMILVVRVSDMETNFISGITPMSITHLKSGEKSSLLVFNGGDEKLLSIGTDGENYPVVGEFESGFYDFGDETKRKTIKRLTSQQKGVVTYVILSDTGEGEEVTAESGILDHRMMVTGNAFKLIIKSSDPECEVNKITIETS